MIITGTASGATPNGTSVSLTIPADVTPGDSIRIFLGILATNVGFTVTGSGVTRFTGYSAGGNTASYPFAVELANAPDTITLADLGATYTWTYSHTGPMVAMALIFNAFASLSQGNTGSDLSTASSSGGVPTDAMDQVTINALLTSSQSPPVGGGFGWTTPGVTVIPIVEVASGAYDLCLGIGLRYIPGGSPPLIPGITATPVTPSAWLMDTETGHSGPITLPPSNLHIGKLSLK